MKSNMRKNENVSSMYENTNETEFDLLDKFKDLIVEHNLRTGSNIPTEYTIDLSESQTKAFEQFKKGGPMLILGSAGSGKSKLIKEFYKYIQKQNKKTIYLTSTTGISAYNIGGITINSFMGIGTAEAPVELLLKRIRSKIGIRNRIKLTDVLVIDEISMMSASTFEKINIICQTLRKSNKPFGGIQIVLTGDMLQLETIFNNENIDRRLIIESELFIKMFNDSTVILKENFRQKNDNLYIDLLLRIRENKYTVEDIQKLQSRLIKKDQSDIIHLVSSNKKAQAINIEELNKISSEDVNYESVYSHFGDKETCDILVKELKTQFTQKGIETVRLRKGCRVLLSKNLDVSIGLVNGSVGTVEDLMEDSVKVKFDNGVTETINRVEWELEIDNTKVSCTQIPLMLAYSITIHKSQSLSLDKAVLDLADCFCNHMVYVALSRIRSLEGVYLKSFNHKKITVNKKLLEYIMTF